MKNSIFYDVILKKTFTYPKSMLEKGAEIENAERNAAIEIEKVINEIANNKFEQINIQQFFTFETKEKKGWKLREEPTELKQVNINDVVDYLTQLDIEKKYGILNIEENPDLFECDINNNVESWFLKSEIEDEFSKIRNQHKNKLKNFYIFNINSDEHASTRRTESRTTTQGIYQRISNIRNSHTPGFSINTTPTAREYSSDFIYNSFFGTPITINNSRVEQPIIQGENTQNILQNIPYPIITNDPPIENSVSRSGGYVPYNLR